MCYENVFRHAGIDGDLLAARGLLLERRYDRKAALEEYGRAIEFDPGCFLARINRANLLLEREKAKEALVDATQAMLLSPRAPAGYILCSLALVKTGDLPGAFLRCNQAIELDPGNGSCFNCRAVLRSYLEDWKGAEEDTTRAIVLDPKLHYARISRAAARVRLGRLEEALSDLDVAVARKPNSVDAWYNRAWVLGLLRRRSESIESLSRVLTLDAAHLGARLTRGKAYFESGEYALAEADCTSTIRLDPTNGTARRLRARARVKLRRFLEAQGDASVAIALDSRDANAWASWAHGAFALSKWGEAFLGYTRAIELVRPQSYLHCRRAWTLFHLGLNRSSFLEAGRALQLNSLEEAAYNARGESCMESTFRFQRLENGLQAVALRPQDADSHHLLGTGWAFLRDFPRAISEYSRAMVLDPGYKHAYLRRGQARLSLARRGGADSETLLRGAIEDCQAYLKMDPGKAGELAASKVIEECRKRLRQ